MAAQRTAWTSTVWGAKGVKAERLQLPKGEESCHICMESMVEVNLVPCKHQICLECCNRLRAANIFKVDAGIRCPLCRDYVEQFTDLRGNPSSVPSLRAANEAASKSTAARAHGALQSVSTSIPDASRLVPHHASMRVEPTWCCVQCQNLNVGNRDACSRCGCFRKDSGNRRVNGGRPEFEALTCTADDAVQLLHEKGHASLARALSDAGTPYQGEASLKDSTVGGTANTIREALLRKGHERLLRLVHMLLTDKGKRLIPACQNTYGTVGMQRILDSLQKLQKEAIAFRQSGHALHEDFHTFAASSHLSAATAYSVLVRALTSHTVELAMHDKSYWVMDKIVHGAPPLDLISATRIMVRNFEALLPPQSHPHDKRETHEATSRASGYVGIHHHHQQQQQQAGGGSAYGATYICRCVTRLCNMSFEATAEATMAGDTLASLLDVWRSNYRVIVYHARHRYLGQAIMEAVQGALPRPEAFVACHIIACEAAITVRQGNKINDKGVHTILNILSLTPADDVSRRLIRDLACAVACSLRFLLPALAVAADQGGTTLVQALLDLCLKEREDQWVLYIISALVEHGAELVKHDEAFDLLCNALASPLLDPAVLTSHLTSLEAAGVDVDALGTQIQTEMSVASPLQRPFHEELSDYQPDTDTKFVRHHPSYVHALLTQRREAQSQQQHAQPQEMETPVSQLEQGEQQQQQQQQQQHLPVQQDNGNVPSAGAVDSFDAAKLFPQPTENGAMQLQQQATSETRPSSHLQTQASENIPSYTTYAPTDYSFGNDFIGSNSFDTSMSFNAATVSPEQYTAYANVNEAAAAGSLNFPSVQAPSYRLPPSPYYPPFESYQSQAFQQSQPPQQGHDLGAPIFNTMQPSNQGPSLHPHHTTASQTQQHLSSPSTTMPAAPRPTSTTVSLDPAIFFPAPAPSHNITTFNTVHNLGLGLGQQQQQQQLGVQAQLPSSGLNEGFTTLIDMLEELEASEKADNGGRLPSFTASHLLPIVPTPPKVSHPSTTVPLTSGSSSSGTDSQESVSQPAAQYAAADVGPSLSNTTRSPTLSSPQQQHHQQQQGPAMTQAVQTWTCSRCTYFHIGKEAEYLSCAVCATQRIF